MGATRNSGIILMVGAVILAVLLVIGVLDEPAAFYEAVSQTSSKFLLILLILICSFGLGLNIYWITREVTRSAVMLRLSTICVGLVPVCVLSTSLLVGLEGVKIHYGQTIFELTRKEPVWAIVSTLVVIIITAFLATNAAARYEQDDIEIFGR